MSERSLNCYNANTNIVENVSMEIYRLSDITMSHIKVIRL